MEINDDGDDDVFGTLQRWSTIYLTHGEARCREESVNSWFVIPMQLYLCSLPPKRLIDGAEHQRNLCSASDRALPLARCLKHTLAIDAHLEYDQANL